MAAVDELADEVAVCQPGDQDRGGPFRLFLDVLAYTLGPLADIVRDTDDGPGWSSIVDPDRARDSDLGWLAQIPGVVLTRGATPEQQREEIRIAAGLLRGTPASMRAAVHLTLATDRTPEQAVRILEHTSTAYTMAVVTRTSETPDAAAAEAAARSQKPAGLVLTFLTSDEPLIDEGTDTIDSASATIDSATLADVT